MKTYRMKSLHTGGHCVYLLAVGEGFGAGRVTVPHSGWPVLWKAAPFQQETTEVIIAISLLIAR